MYGLGLFIVLPNCLHGDFIVSYKCFSHDQVLLLLTFWFTMFTMIISLNRMCFRFDWFYDYKSHLYGHLCHRRNLWPEVVYCRFTRTIFVYMLVSTEIFVSITSPSFIAQIYRGFTGEFAKKGCGSHVIPRLTADLSTQEAVYRYFTRTPSEIAKCITLGA